MSHKENWITPEQIGFTGTIQEVLATADPDEVIPKVVQRHVATVDPRIEIWDGEQPVGYTVLYGSNGFLAIPFYNVNEDEEIDPDNIYLLSEHFK